MERRGERPCGGRTAGRGGGRQSRWGASESRDCLEAIHVAGRRVLDDAPRRGGGRFRVQRLAFFLAAEEFEQAVDPTGARRDSFGRRRLGIGLGRGHDSLALLGPGHLEAHLAPGGLAGQTFRAGSIASQVPAGRPAGLAARNSRNYWIPKVLCGDTKPAPAGWKAIRGGSGWGIRRCRRCHLPLPAGGSRTAAG